MVTPYITFNGNCREALMFYQNVFKSEIKMMQLYGEYIPEGIDIFMPLIGLNTDLTRPKPSINLDNIQWGFHPPLNGVSFDFYFTITNIWYYN